MSKKANPRLVGAFVLGALGLAVAAIVVLGGADLFRSRPEAVTYFEGSVNGLQPGAPVNWRGVRIGSVTHIRMDFDANKHTVHIPVFMEFEPERLNIVGGPEGTLRIKDLVSKGLRAQLQLQSVVTGQLEIELDMRPETPPRFQGPDQFLTPEIPSVKSDFETLKETVERLPLRELGETAIAAIANINRLVSSPELKTMIAQLSASAQELQGTLAEVHGEVKPLAGSIEGGANAVRDTFVGMQQVEADLRKTLDDIQKTTSNAGADADKVTADLHTTLTLADQSFRQAQVALSSADSLIAPNSPQRADLNQILRNLTYATQALRSFSEQLDRNPNALITGKK